MTAPAKPAKIAIIIVHETALQSWGRDASTFALAVGLIGVGVLMDSSAAQWLGLFVTLAAVLMRSSGKVKRLNVAEARAYLDQIEGRQ